MNRNGLLAALYTLIITMCGVGVFWSVISLIKYYPELTGYIFTLCMASIIFMVFIHPIWESIKEKLDNGNGR